MNPRRRKILWIVLSSLAGLTVCGIAAALIIVQTQWFRDFVRTKMIQTVQDSTGGKVEIAAFSFDWRQMRADVDEFVLHGTEPANAKPLLRIRHVAVGLKIVSLFAQRKVDLASLAVDQPQANVMVFPDGSTNVPNPRVRAAGDTSALETLVDLAIRRFTVSGGSIDFAGQKAMFQGRGEKLQAHLDYEMAGQRYRGQISISPLYVQVDGNPRLEVAVNLPLLIEKDRIQLNGATLATASSKVTAAGVLEHIASPVISGGVNAQLDVAEMRRTLGVPGPMPARDRGLDTLYANVDLKSDRNNVQIRTVKVALGHSMLQAFGTAQTLALDKGSLQFSSSLDLRELGQLLAPPARAGGTLRVDGTVVTGNQASNYAVNANLTGRQLAFYQGSAGVSNTSLTAKVRADPANIAANPIRVSVANGRWEGSATLANRSHYRVQGKFEGVGIQELAAALTGNKTAWSGTIGGPVEAEGDLDSTRQPSLQAHARLTVNAGNRGLPISGRLNADYNARLDALEIGRSYLALPASRVDFSGSLKQGLDVHLTSANLNDFQPAVAIFSKTAPASLPVKFDAGGAMTLDARLTGTVRAPQISGHIAARRFRVGERQFDQLAADVSASRNAAAVQNAAVTRGELEARISASVGLDQWEAKPFEPLKIDLTVRGADVQDVLALTGQTQIPIRGDLTLSAQATGTVGDPRGAADLTIVNGVAYDQPFDRIQAKATYAGQSVTVPYLQAASGSALVNATAAFEHPENSFSTGKLHVHLDTNPVALEQLSAVQRRRPDLAGVAQSNMDVDANLVAGAGESSLQLVAVNGKLALRGLRARTGNLGDFAAEVQTAGSQLSYRVSSNFAGSAIRADGRTGLTPDYPTTANVSIQNLPVDQVLGLVGGNVPARGLLSAKGELSGSLHDPRADLDVDFTKAVLYQQPFDRIEGHINYSAASIDVPSLRVAIGSSRVSLSGAFAHPPHNFSKGDVRLHVAGDAIQLAQVRYLQQQRPGVAGALNVNLDAAATFDGSGPSVRILPSSVKGNVAARGVRMDGRDYGDLRASALQSGSALTVNLDSNLAQSSIQAKLQTQLAGDYPSTVQVSFHNINYGSWSGLLGMKTEGGPRGFDAVAEGSVSASVTLLKPSNLTGSAQISKLEVSSQAPSALIGQPVRAADAIVKTTTLALKNDGPIAFSMTPSAIQIQKASMVGESTRLSVGGSVTLKPALALALTVNGDANLALLHSLNPSTSAEGKIALNARIQGPLNTPAVYGKLELNNAAFQTEDMPNGISKANGVVQFTGDAARIEALTAESGGGKVTIAGFVGRSGSALTYGVTARANQVRVRQASGLSVVGNANVKLTGTSETSLLSGDVLITRVGFNPQTDFGSMLSGSSTPPEIPTAATGPLAGMKLNVNVRTSPGAAFQTTLAENLRAQATLTVRGTLANPGVLGRIVVSEGVLTFFGTNYTVNDASISFYNPNKVDPIVNLSLVTKTRGVEVTLDVTGPVNNMNLAYQSDPPLPFSEIVGLLATGKMPTSDPVLLANQPAAPSQNFQQMGESALLGQAVSNPIAGQLQRVFGVSQLKIDPTFTSGSELPQARLTLQQQITNGLTFTYVTNLTRSNSQIIRVEWALNAQWSVIASREENGLFGVDFFYKRRFR